MEEETKGIEVLTVEVVIPEKVIVDVVKDKRTRKLTVKLLRKLKKTVQEYVTSSNVRIDEDTRFLSFKLSELVDVVKPFNRIIFEKLIYLLSRHNIVFVKCIASTLNTLGPKSIRRNLDLSGSSRDLAEKMLFYMYTTGNENLRRKRREYWYDLIRVFIPVKVEKKQSET